MQGMQLIFITLSFVILRDFKFNSLSAKSKTSLEYKKSSENMRKKEALPRFGRPHGLRVAVIRGSTKGKNSSSEVIINRVPLSHSQELTPPRKDASNGGLSILVTPKVSNESLEFTNTKILDISRQGTNNATTIANHNAYGTSDW
jgi:hypothetical protein